jgi:hypothetical protein
LHRRSQVSGMSAHAQAAVIALLHGVAMTTNRTPAIDVGGLRKSYGDLKVLDGVDLQVAVGTAFACSVRMAPARPRLSRSSPR